MCSVDFAGKTAGTPSKIALPTGICRITRGAERQATSIILTKDDESNVADFDLARLENNPSEAARGNVTFMAPSSLTSVRTASLPRRGRVPRRDRASRHEKGHSGNRLTLRSCTTEHHEGKGERIISLSLEIREHLQAVFNAAPEGTIDVIGRYRKGANLNPHFRWIFMRATRQTKLAATFPLHTVCAWIGNTKAVAAGHLQITDADWTRATASDEAAANPATNQAKQTRPHETTPARPHDFGSNESPRNTAIWWRLVSDVTR